MTLTKWSWLLYGPFITIVSFVRLLRIDAWWVRIWDFPHTQYGAPHI